MCSGWFEMRGGRGLFIGISNQSGTSRVAARVSLRMAPDACAATPRAPHGWLHVLFSCRMTPRPPPVWMHGLAPCNETSRPPHVWPHDPVACIATPRAWPIHFVLHMSTCMYRLHVLQHLLLPLTHTLPGDCHHVLNTHQATSSFSVNSADFGLSGEFLSRGESQIVFYARSDCLSIFNKPHLDIDFEEKYFPSFRLLQKNS